MIRKKIALGILGSMALGACQANTTTTDPYRLEMSFHDGFQILWLSDIHWGWSEDNPDYIVETAHLKGMIQEAQTKYSPDLMVLTGDSFRSASSAQVKELLSLIDSFGIPWAFTYGNHDTETFASYRYYINDQINACKNQVFVDVKNDSLTGLTNYYINLVCDQKTVYRLYIIDSNTYQDPEVEGSGYDVIHQEQLDHLENIQKSAGDNAPGLAFFHIPLTEYTAAYQGYQIGLYKGRGSNGETVCSPYKNNGAYSVLKSINVKACFCGHDHKNYSDVFYKNEMILSYAAKATDLDYHTEGLYGYKMISLPKDASAFTYENITMHYYLY